MSSDCDLDEPVLTLAKLSTRYDTLPERVLDSGAGCGKISFLYPRLPIFRRNQLPRPEMVGIDIDRGELGDLRKATDHAVLASSVSLPFRDHTFQLGFLLEVIEHLNPSKGATAIREMLRTCGRIVVSTPKNIEAYHVPSHVHQWSSRELADMGLKQYPHRSYLIFTNIAFPSRVVRFRRWLIPETIRARLRGWFGSA